MRHVDDGTIHAWLDEQITDPAEAAWIQEHVRGCTECSARLADARATVDRAQALLAATAPAVERPSFEALVARAGNDTPGSGTAPVARSAHERRHRLLVQAGWAASLVLAAGLGWTAREVTDRDTIRQDPVAAMAERAAVTTSDSIEPAESPRPAAEPAAGADAAAPTTEPQARRQTANATPQRVEPRARAEPAAPAPERERPSLSQEAITQTAAPPAAVPARPATPRQEGIVVTGEAAAFAGAPADTDWRPLPRTEAAARTGMPLYGIDGLEPVLTALNADDSLVRTVYRLASGDVELVQQRVAPDTARGGAPIAEMTTRQALAAPGRGGTVADPRTSVRRTWSSVHGGVRITLQTASDAEDLSALGSKLRVD